MRPGGRWYRSLSAPWAAPPSGAHPQWQSKSRDSTLDQPHWFRVWVRYPGNGRSCRLSCGSSVCFTNLDTPAAASPRTPPQAPGQPRSRRRTPSPARARSSQDQGPIVQPGRLGALSQSFSRSYASMKPQGCVRSKCRSATSAILSQHSGGDDGIGGDNQEMALTLGADLRTWLPWSRPTRGTSARHRTFAGRAGSSGGAGSRGCGRVAASNACPWSFPREYEGRPPCCHA